MGTPSIILGVILLCAQLIGHAADRYNLSAVILDSTCSSIKVLSYVKPEHKAAMKNARVAINFIEKPACWTTIDGQVVLMTEDGNMLMLPVSAFNKVVDI